MASAAVAREWLVSSHWFAVRQHCTVVSLVIECSQLQTRNDVDGQPCTRLPGRRPGSDPDRVPPKAMSRPSDGPVARAARRWPSGSLVGASRDGETNGRRELSGGLEQEEQEMSETMHIQVPAEFSESSRSSVPSLALLRLHSLLHSLERVVSCTGEAALRQRASDALAARLAGIGDLAALFPPRARSPFLELSLALFPGFPSRKPLRQS